jgi:hypothetical protein
VTGRSWKYRLATEVSLAYAHSLLLASDQKRAYCLWTKEDPVDPSRDHRVVPRNASVSTVIIQTHSVCRWKICHYARRTAQYSTISLATPADRVQAIVSVTAVHGFGLWGYSR